MRYRAAEFSLASPQDRKLGPDKSTRARTVTRGEFVEFSLETASRIG